MCVCVCALLSGAVGVLMGVAFIDVFSLDVVVV